MPRSNSETGPVALPANSEGKLAQLTEDAAASRIQDSCVEMLLNKYPHFKDLTPEQIRRYALYNTPKEQQIANEYTDIANEYTDIEVNSAALTIQNAWRAYKRNLNIRDSIQKNKVPLLAQYRQQKLEEKLAAFSSFPERGSSYLDSPQKKEEVEELMRAKKATAAGSGSSLGHTPGLQRSKEGGRVENVLDGTPRRLNFDQISSPPSYFPIDPGAL